MIFRCDEVVKDKVLTEGRLAVEEAITAAKIRRCPSCKKGFIKESGCNKITCGCGNKICYLCQESITGYEHFCRTPHCTHKDGCTKCPLYTNAEEDDLRAMRQAGFTAAEEVKLAHAGTADLQIDVNGILNAK
jgi:E3 ubiquitin-protein ligase RNF216